MEATSPLVICRREEGLCWIQINRPDKLNALSLEVLGELRGTLEAVVHDRGSRVILLTGAGDRAFAAGADIGQMHSQDAVGIRKMMDLGKDVALLLETAPQPVLAVVNGYALGGGCELALACDLILASEKAQFGLPEVDLGVLPGWGGSQRLERRVGYGRARDMILTGRRVGAVEALSWGLSDRVFPPDRLRDEAATLGKGLAAKDPEALATAKRALRWRSELPLSESLRLETDAFVELFQRPEREAAMDRFLNRS